MGRKQEETPKYLPSRYVNVSRAENGWVLSDITNCREVISVRPLDVLAWVGEFLGIKLESQYLYPDSNGYPVILIREKPVEKGEQDDSTKPRK